ncbi:hypothetical protein [Denitrificimonas caeni]|uniref:Uncharacterized protein n=1 Tax=Denitrificimonas caeni TaxID=521720 RepID=A0AAE9VQC8_9GAMM|nr:hypothetical protein [Denitrificimonas caeni]WBE26346.1 hypothetical protein O6P33_05845 [Denitrificimonas caeni]
MHTIPVNGALSISTIDRVAGVLPKERRDNASENTLVMQQLANNTPEQTMLGNLPKP